MQQYNRREMGLKEIKAVIFPEEHLFKQLKSGGESFPHTSLLYILNFCYTIRNGRRTFQYNQKAECVAPR